MECDVESRTRYRIRDAKLSDARKLAPLLFDCMGEIYPNRERTTELVYEFTIRRWVETENKDLVIVVDGDEVIGFISGQIEDFDNLLDPYYSVPLIYVIPERRKGRATCLLYHWLWEHMEMHEMIVETIPLNEVALSHTKKFGAVKFGTLMESSKFILDTD